MDKTFRSELIKLIDEFAVWNRVLTSDERTYLYNSGNGRTYTAGKIE